MRIGHLSTFYHTSLVLLAWGDAGKRLDAGVEWRLFGTGPEIVKAFERNELDLAYIGLPPAIIGIDRGIDIKCIAGGHIEGTVISGKNQFRGFPDTDSLCTILEQFSGLRLGVPGKGSIHDVILREALERFGLKDKIEVVNYAWADQITEAAARNEVAAAFGTPALSVALTRYAGCKVLYPPSRLWPSNPSYGIIVAGRFMREQREIAERFILLHEHASSFLRNQPEDAAKNISEYVGFIDREFVMETLRMSPKYCAQLSDGYLHATMQFVPAMKRLGYIKRELSPSEIFDVSLIKKVHPGGDHYGAGNPYYS